MKWGRTMEAFAAMVRGVLPTLDYQASYFGKVVAFNFDRQEVDVVPDDARMPTMAGVPLRGLPGAIYDLRRGPGSNAVADGVTVVISWENGDPSRPYAMGFGKGAHVPSITLNADQIILGGGDGTEPAAKGQTLQTFLNSLTASLVAHFHPASSGTTSPSAQLTGLEAPNVLAMKAKVN